jgi:hypothetical protein
MSVHITVPTPLYLIWFIYVQWSGSSSPLNPKPHSYLHYPTQFPCKTITLHPGKWPFCALWAYLLGIVNRMARISIDKPPDPTLNQLVIKWSPLRTLHEGSGDRYEVALLMAPKTITPWARHSYTTGYGVRS